MKVVIGKQTIGDVDLFGRDIEECEIQTSPVIRLYLDRNRLTSFVVGDRAFPNLVTLYLDRNQLTSFAVGDRAFPNLEHLNLARNLLTSFVVDGAFPNLKSFDLSSNPIQVLDLYRSQVPKLNRVWLENTGIEFVDPSVIETIRGKKVEPRSHLIGTVCLVEEAFFPKGHPIAEEIIEEIQV